MLDSRAIETSENTILAKEETHYIYHLTKRSCDVIVSALALVILSPLILTLMIAIFMQDGHNPIYMQTRVGKHGKLFKMYKFRSMVNNADQVLKKDTKLYKKYVANGFKLPQGEDPRVTKLGAFLRRTSLDEIPQFVNVLRGEMSLVGPRPIVVAEQIEYGPRLREFLSVKPGALGLWQASGRANIGYPERCDVELTYVRNASAWYDVKVFFKCCLSILERDGAF